MSGKYPPYGARCAKIGEEAREGYTGERVPPDGYSHRFSI